MLQGHGTLKQILGLRITGSKREALSDDEDDIKQRQAKSARKPGTANKQAKANDR